MRPKIFKPIAVLLLVLALLVATFYIVIQTHFFNQITRNVLNSFVTELTDQGFAIGSIDGNLLHGFTLRDVSFRIEGREFIECKGISIRYSLPLMLDRSTLFRRVFSVDEVSLTGVRVNLIRYSDGAWNFEKIKSFGRKEQAPLGWSIFLNSTNINDLIITVSDPLKEKSNKYEFRNVDASVKIHRAIERVDLKLKDGEVVFTSQIPGSDTNELRLDGVSANASYSALEYVDTLDVKSLNFNFRGFQISAESKIKDLKSPKFEFRATAGGIRLGNIVNANIELSGVGEHSKHNPLRVQSKARLLDSLLIGQEVLGDINSIDIDGGEIEFRGGKINTDFGSASFNGTLFLTELMGVKQSNNFAFDVSIDSLEMKEILDFIKETKGVNPNSPIGAVNTDIYKGSDAELNAYLNVLGNWGESDSLEASVVVSNLDLRSGDSGEVNLKGPITITNSGVQYELDAGFLNVNLATVFKNEGYISNINSKFRLRGFLPYGKDLLSRLEGSVKGEVFQSEILGIGLKRGIIDAFYGANFLNVESLLIESDKLNLEANGAIGDSQNVGISYDLDVADLRLLSIFLDNTDYEGRLQVSGDLKGAMRSLETSLFAKISDFKSEKYRFVAKKIEITGSSNFDLADLRLNASGNLGEISIRGRDFSTIDIDAKGKSSVLGGEIRVSETVNRNYSASFTLRNLQDEEVSLELSKVVLNVQDVLLKNRKPIILTFIKNKLSVSSLNLYQGDNFIIGDIELGDKVVANMRSRKMRLSSLLDVLNAPFSLKGLVSGKIAFGGSLEDIDVSADLVAENLEYMAFKSDALRLSLLFVDDDLNVSLSMNNDSERVLSATAKAHVDPKWKNFEEIIENAPFDARVQSKGIDISLLSLLHPKLTSIKGRLFADVSARGDGQNPDIAGSFELKDVSLKTVYMRNKINIESVVLDVRGMRGVLRPFHIDTGGGEGFFEGEIDFRDMSYVAKGRMFELFFKPNPYDVTARLDGELDIKGKRLKTHINGDLKAKGLRVVISGKPQRYIEDVKFVQEDDGDQEGFIFAGEKSDSRYRRLVSVDLRLDIAEDSWIKSSRADIEIEGQLNVSKRYGGGNVVTGNVEAVKGSYLFMGKLFSIIQGGIMNFSGKEVIDPLLGVRAIYDVSNVEVYVNVTGTMRDPEISLSSDPSMEKNEIMSYLIFGTSSDELSTNERISFQQRAGEFLGSMAVDEIRDVFGDQFALDVITIKGWQPGFRDTYFELGKYITKDLYVGYERYFFSPGASLPDVAANRAIVEYRMLDYLTLETEIGGAESGADLFFNFDY